MEEIETYKTKKRRFPCHAPFRCSRQMHDALMAKVDELGYDSISSYLRVLVGKDLGLDKPCQ